MPESGMVLSPTFLLLGLDDIRIGYDHNDGKRKGTYVTVLAARPTLRGLSKHLGDFLPAAPVASPLVVKVA
jgi:hypothetical protein